MFYFILYEVENNNGETFSTCEFLLGGSIDPFPGNWSDTCFQVVLVFGFFFSKESGIYRNQKILKQIFV